MPGTLRKFDDTAISNIFSVLKYYFVAKESGKGLSAEDFTSALKTKLEALKLTDNIAFEFTDEPQDNVSYFSLGAGATGTNTVAQAQIISALNSLIGYINGEIGDIDISTAYNGTITTDQSTGQYVGTGNAVPATALDDILNALLTAIGAKVDTTRVDTAVEVDTAANQAKLPTNQAVVTYVTTAISGITGVSFQVLTSGQYSGSSQSFEGDGTTTGFALTDAPKKLRSVYVNELPVSNYTYNATTHTVTFTSAPPAPSTAGTNNIVVNYVPYPTLLNPQGNVFYLVPNGSGTDNVYNEYVYTNNAWEMLGSTENDFSDYVKYEDLNQITVAELNTLFTSATPANS